MIISSNFKPAWWLPGPHLQTIWPALMRRNVDIPLSRERLELPDGDFLDLDWGVQHMSKYDVPLVIVLHGLEGSIDSSYSKGTLRALENAGCRVCFMHFRGCSGEHNRLPRAYHSGDTDDLAYLVRMLKQREPNTPISAVGYSLGGNVLLKWLGETGDANPLQSAAAVSVPFLINRLADKMNVGFSKLYQWHLVRRLRKKFSDKKRYMNIPIDSHDLAKLKSFWEFDDVVTARLHGFNSAKDYYARVSSRQYLKTISVPTLIIHAQDDPFMTPEVIPTSAELSESITLELSRHGGHNGFVSGTIPGCAEYWLESRVPEFIRTSFGR